VKASSFGGCFFCYTNIKWVDQPKLLAKKSAKSKSSKYNGIKERSEDRKTNAVKGHGFEDMMAYVDPNGDITFVLQELASKKMYLLRTSGLECLNKKR